MRQLLLSAYIYIMYIFPCKIREWRLSVMNKKYIYITAFLDYKLGIYHKANWGDDLNIFFLSKIFKKDLVVYQNSIKGKKNKAVNYMLIGSMIHDCTPETIIWGSGVLADDNAHELRYHPKQVLAVRGKLTREYLLQHGVECPEVYGDPALLLPLFYPRKNIEKKYRFGIIPHIYDEKHPALQTLRNNPEVLIISMKDYNDWHEVIDKICSCEMILSSSLHGIIVSDAYHVPNCWIEFSDKVIGRGFKFRDYYSSVKKNIKHPIHIDRSINLEDFWSYKEDWQEPQIDLQPLIDVCPFPISQFLKYDA